MKPIDVLKHVPGRTVLRLIAIAAATYACGLVQAAGSGTETAPSLAKPIIPPMIILAPLEIRTEPTLQQGCWAQLFPRPDYKGDDHLTISGPLDLPSLHTPRGGVDWKEKTESIIVGPRATVMVYENGNYSHQTATLKPGTHEPRLRGNLKFTQSIDSLRIRCEGGK
jgi:Beta/Gamma crystallin